MRLSLESQTRRASRPFALADQAGLYAPAFRIALSYDIPVYDALFLALSKEKGIPLVTSDPSQAGAARRMGLEAEHRREAGE